MENARRQPPPSRYDAVVVGAGHNGLTTDLFSAFYPLGAASPVLRTLALHEHGLQWSHAPAVLAHLLPDGRAAVMSRDLDETAASVDSFASDERTAAMTSPATNPTGTEQRHDPTNGVG